jgi:hypothetical protein
VHDHRSPRRSRTVSGHGVDRWIGPADRHNDGLFDQLRDHLVDGGVAVLAYDKRGAGHPDGCGIRRRLMTWLAMRPPRWRALQRDPRVAADPGRR